MSHYKPYPAYKDSGVEWLGRVPEHWPITKIGRTFAEPPCYGVLVPDFEVGGVPMLRISDMEHAFIDKSGLLTISHELSAQYSRTIVQQGDVVLSVVGTIGKAFEVSEQLAGCNLSRAVARVQPSDSISANYLCKIFDSSAFTRYVDLTCLGSAQRVLNMGDLSGLLFCIPTVEEQIAICAQIDRETARIDALIEKKTRFIELLREKRQALITHAVTKGLAPNLKMKNSGVEWLGEVPEHWEIKPLKLLVKEGSTISYGIVQPGEPLDEGVPFVQTTNMTSGDFNIENLQKTAPEIAAAFPRSRLVGGEVILGIRASIGAAFVAPEHLAGVNLSRGVARIDCSSELLSEFLVAYLASMAVDCYWQLAKQGSTFNEVSIATVKELLVPVPPIHEQLVVNGMLTRETGRFDLLLGKTERSIELLKERRSALITAAVTGQIDLRESA